MVSHGSHTDLKIEEIPHRFYGSYSKWFKNLPQLWVDTENIFQQYLKIVLVLQYLVDSLEIILALT